MADLVDNWRAADCPEIPSRPRRGSLADDERKFAVGHRSLQKHARRNEAGDQHDGLQYGECDHLSLLSYPLVSRSRLWGGSGKSARSGTFWWHGSDFLPNA